MGGHPVAQEEHPPGWLCEWSRGLIDPKIDWLLQTCSWYLDSERCHTRSNTVVEHNDVLHDVV
jgi:hypothetical protein